LRACSPALRRSDRRAAVVSKQAYAFVRGTSEPWPAVVLLSAAGAPTAVTVPAGWAPAGRFVDALTAEGVELSAASPTPLVLAPLSYRVLLREGDPCL
ncbi:MAG: hypothetical protein HY744_07500, partial [Deltaproteobacteria bacterium]|nr:hypothetical protein [Deltaproteobacteria bacterium]